MLRNIGRYLKTRKFQILGEKNSKVFWPHQLRNRFAKEINFFYAEKNNIYIALSRCEVWSQFGQNPIGINVKKIGSYSTDAVWFCKKKSSNRQNMPSLQ